MLEQPFLDGVCKVGAVVQEGREVACMNYNPATIELSPDAGGKL